MQLLCAVPMSEKSTVQLSAPYFRCGTVNPLDYSTWDILRELVYEGRREPFANLKDLQNVIRDKWHDVDDQTMRKVILQWKRCLATVAKQNVGPIKHIFC